MKDRTKYIIGELMVFLAGTIFGFGLGNYVRFLLTGV